MIFTKLFLVHLLFDFVFQSTKVVHAKQKFKHKSYHLYLHAFMHGLFSFLIIGKLNFLPFALSIYVLHFLIDLYKLNKTNNHSKWFFIDQLLHIVVLIVVWFFYTKPSLNFIAENQIKILKLLTAVIFLTTPTAYIVKNIISNWTPKIEHKQQEDLQSAGKFIGILERLLIFIFITCNQWTAVGFILTAKSVFRFSDLKSGNRQLTEYVLLGTLISFFIAILTSLICLL